jgi:hypothetical protein
MHIFVFNNYLETLDGHGVSSKAEAAKVVTTSFIIAQCRSYDMILEITQCIDRQIADAMTSCPTLAEVAGRGHFVREDGTLVYTRYLMTELSFKDRAKTPQLI